jgi:hypothetical protein
MLLTELGAPLLTEGGLELLIEGSDDMPFPASTLRLAPALDRVAGEMGNLKSYAANRRAAMAAGDVGSNWVLDIWENLFAIKTRLQSYAAIPGIAAYAQEQYGNGSLDIAAEFNSVIAAIDAVRANIQSTFPVDGSGYLLARQFGAGVFTERQFTSAQTATLRGLLSNLEATIA